MGQALDQIHPSPVCFADTLPEGEGQRRTSSGASRHLPQRGRHGPPRAAAPTVLFAALTISQQGRLAPPLGELSPQATERAHAAPARGSAKAPLETKGAVAARRLGVGIQFIPFFPFKTEEIEIEPSASFADSSNGASGTPRPTGLQGSQSRGAYP